MSQNQAFGVGNSGSSSLTLTLNHIWRVNQDNSYRVSKIVTDNKNLIAVITLDGEGRVNDIDNNDYLVPKNSLLFLELKKIKNYETKNDYWDFWWFDFYCPANLPFEYNVIYPIYMTAVDNKMTEDICEKLQSEIPQERSLASSIFAMLLSRWSTNEKSEFSNKDQVVQQSIRIMKENLELNITIDQLAARNHLTPRRLHQIFVEVTGSSPKKYYDNLRLEYAKELLQMGLGNVTQVSYRLNYTTPFYFSKAFKKHHKKPPSEFVAKH
ncbi:MAG: AraC family transcriptional regulator [Planctomycetota bacterium]|jgi:AraC-like DNA-binding protein